MKVYFTFPFTNKRVSHQINSVKVSGTNNNLFPLYSNSTVADEVGLSAKNMNIHKAYGIFYATFHVVFLGILISGIMLFLRLREKYIAGEFFFVVFCYFKPAKNGIRWVVSECWQWRWFKWKSERFLCTGFLSSFFCNFVYYSQSSQRRVFFQFQKNNICMFIQLLNVWTGVCYIFFLLKL